MALSDTVTKVVYAPDGAQVRFDIPFPLFDARDVECIAVDAAGAESPITAFSVVGMQSESGPAVVFDAPPAAGVTLVIRRYTRQVHETTYPEGGKFPSRVVELDFDRIVAMIQELNEVVDRSLKVNVGEESPPESAEELYSRIVQIAERAEAAVTEAAGSAAAADVSAGAAAGSASAAAASEVSAEYYMEMARKWAVNPEDVPVLAGLFSAYHWALKAREWASGGIILSDALDGERKAADGVGASEWALAQAYARAGEALDKATTLATPDAPGIVWPGASESAVLLARDVDSFEDDWYIWTNNGDGTGTLEIKQGHLARLIALGGGGGGGGGYRNGAAFAGGGAQGGQHVFRSTYLSAGQMIPVVFGSEGIGGQGVVTSTTIETPGTEGGSTSFGDIVTALGGKAGVGQSSNSSLAYIGIGSQAKEPSDMYRYRLQMNSPHAHVFTYASTGAMQYIFPGTGGDSLFGTGGAAYGGSGGAADGGPGTGYGSGGAGGRSAATLTCRGGNGAPGCIYIERIA